MVQTTTLPNVHVQTPEPPVDQAVQRLRDAIRQAGGQTAISARSGIKMRSLSNYMTGLNDMKRQTVVTLADACGVTIEWLAAGRGPMRPTDSPPSSRRQEDGPAKLFATVDMTRLARCLDAVTNAFGPKAPNISTRRKVQIATLLYDAMMDETSDLNTFLSDSVMAAEKATNNE